MPFSGWPWYAQIVAWIVVAIILFAVFERIVLPLLAQL